MAMKRLNVGKFTKNPIANSKQTKSWKTEKMFRNIDELMARKEILEKQKKEVNVNPKLLTLQYR